jgi:DNA-binding PadR family transcriptional regulator
MRRLNTSRYAVLGMLSLGPQSGYDIKKLVERSIAHFWNESFGQIYPILRQLEADGLAARRSERQTGKPDRQVYSLTSKGLAELREWLGRPASAEIFRSELLLKIFLGGHVPVEASIRHVEQFKARQEQFLRTYAEVDGRLTEEHTGHPDLPYWLMTLRYGQLRAEALVRWSDETLRGLGQLRRRPPTAKPRGAKEIGGPAQASRAPDPLLAQRNSGGSSMNGPAPRRAASAPRRDGRDGPMPRGARRTR